MSPAACQCFPAPRAVLNWCVSKEGTTVRECGGRRSSVLVGSERRRRPTNALNTTREKSQVGGRRGQRQRPRRRRRRGDVNGPQTCISFTLCPNLFPCDLGERIRRRFSCNDRSSRCLPTVTQQRVNASPGSWGGPQQICAQSTEVRSFWSLVSTSAKDEHSFIQQILREPPRVTGSVLSRLTCSLG